MMDLSILYQDISKEKKITLKRLTEAGIGLYELDRFLEAGILKHVEGSTSIFEVADVNKLYSYGKNLIANSEIQNANSVFDTCYSLDPNNYTFNLQLLYRCLVGEISDGNDIFTYFDVIYKELKGSFKERDANFYLLLLGYLYGVPERYNDVFINIEDKDILIREDSDKNKAENKMRRLVLENSYYDANTAMEERFKTYGNGSSEEKLERELVLKIMVKNRLFNRSIYNYINDDRIVDLKKALDIEDEKRFLSRTNQYLLRVINEYLTIQSTMVVPDVTKVIDTNVFEAIKAHDYRGALKAADAYNEKMKMKRVSYIQLMLQKINKLIDEVNEYNLTSPDKKETPVVKEENKEKEYKRTLSEEEQERIDNYINELLSGRSAVLLDAMPIEKHKAVCDYIRGVKNIAFSEIGFENNKRLVLRYKPHIYQFVDVMETVREAKRCLYKTKNYHSALEKYALILRIGNPRDITYAEYGLTLAKLKREKEAIDYLKIATIMSKSNGGKLDYSDLIHDLENGINAEKKPEIVMDEKEFDDNKQVDLDMTFLSDLIMLVHEGDIKLIDACKQMNLSDEEINYVKLLYARDCYYLRAYEEGDLYYKQVEKSKAKTKEIKKLMNELLLSKRFYYNRLDDDKKQLIFRKS